MNASARTTSTAMGAFAERAPIRSRATVSPFPAAPDAIGRNAPCPCASGRRYKHCHGTDGPAPLPVIPEAVAGIMRRALACQRAEHLQEAAALYREALAQVPDLPDAVHMLGVTHLQAGDYDEALAVLRRAAELFGWRLPSVRHNLGLALAAIVARHDRPDAARLWEEYDRWRDRVRGERRAASPLVSVVVPSFNHARYVTEALESVFRQSYANIEIVVVDDGSTDDSPARIRAALARSPFPAHFVERGNRGAAPTINEGIALARGEFVNVLNSDDRFAPTRIATMVDAVARAGFQWGFSRAVSIGAAGEALAASASQRAGDLAYMIDGVAACDTVGMAFLSSNRALSSGTLFCARSLLDRLGGFADLRYNNDWDFCLRACCIAEPVFVSSPEYEYRLHGANTILESAAAAKREADAMFERFHREAAALTAPENPFAPVPSVWGARFYEQMLASGRAALLPPEVLRELTDRVAATYGFAPVSAAERAQDARRPRGARRDATHGEEPTSAAPLAASVIVALNPHDSDPRRLFAGYLAQTIAPVAFEVIVADGGARPDFATAYAEHVRAFPDTPIRTIAAPARGRAAANNAGAQAARAELLIFVADDFVPCPTLVRAHVEFHRHRAAPAVGVGPAYFPEEVRGDPFCRWLEDSGQQFGVPFRVAEQRWPREFFYVGNVSLDRGLFERAGGFDPAFAYDVNDDYEFGLRLAALGVVSHFLPKAAAWHDHRLTFDERTEAMRRAGAAARQVEARHPERPAHPLAQQPLAALDAAVARTRLALARDATSASRGDYYVAAMNLAFARGYHESAAAPPPDPARS